MFMSSEGGEGRKSQRGRRNGFVVEGRGSQRRGKEERTADVEREKLVAGSGVGVLPVEGKAREGTGRSKVRQTRRRE